MGYGKNRWTSEGKTNFPFICCAGNCLWTHQLKFDIMRDLRKLAGIIVSLKYIFIIKGRKWNDVGSLPTNFAEFNYIILMKKKM